MNVLLLKCDLPHDTVIVCVRPGQYPLKKDDPTFSSLEAAFLLVEVFYYVPNVTHPARKRSVCAGLKRGDPGNEIDQCLPRSAMLLFGFFVLCAS